MQCAVLFVSEFQNFASCIWRVNFPLHTHPLSLSLSGSFSLSNPRVLLWFGPDRLNFATHGQKFLEAHHLSFKAGARSSQTPMARHAFKTMCIFSKSVYLASLSLSLSVPFHLSLTLAPFLSLSLSLSLSLPLSLSISLSLWLLFSLSHSISLTRCLSVTVCLSTAAAGQTATAE